MTGPNVSSFMVIMEWLTFVRTTGAMKFPFNAVFAREKVAFSGVTSIAPLLRASSMWDWILTLAGAETTGPVVVVLSWGSPSLYL